MKALSLWQPWASAIALGYKRVETRSWGTRYRGPLLIHAAKTQDGVQDYKNRIFLLERVTDFFTSHATTGVEYIPKESLGMLPYGGIVAQARLIDVVRIDKAYFDSLSVQEVFWGNYERGRYAWILDDIQPLAFRPARGRQGLFNLLDS